MNHFKKIINSKNIAIDKIIQQSENNYKILLSADFNDIKNCENLFNFIVEDNYGFNCLLEISDCLLKTQCWKTQNIGNQSNNISANLVIWNNIKHSVIKYNSYLKNYEPLNDKLHILMDKYKMDNEKYNFLVKIIKTPQINSKTRNMIEKNITKLQNISAIKFNVNIDDISISNSDQLILNKYLVDNLDKQSVIHKNIQIDLNAYKYLLCNIESQNLRALVNHKYFSFHEQSIVDFVYMIINKKILAHENHYNNYLEYVLSKHDNYDILNQFKGEDLSKRISNIIGKIIQNIETYDNTINKILPNSHIMSYDVDYYVNLFNHSYEFNNNLFNIEKCINNILSIMGTIFDVHIRKDLKVKNNIENVNLIYYVYDATNIIGEINCDLFSRQQKINKITTFHLNNNYLKKDKFPVNIFLLSCNVDYDKPFLSFNELRKIIYELGKIFYHIFQRTKYGIPNKCYLNYFCKFLETLILTPDNLKILCSKLLKSDVYKILSILKLEYGFLYKFKCLYALYYIYIYSNNELIQSYKKIIMKTVNSSQTIECLNEMKNQPLDISNDYMKELVELTKMSYNTYYTNIMNCKSYSNIIEHNKNDFQPLLWESIINNDDFNPINSILCDIYALQTFHLYITSATSDKKLQIRETINLINKTDHINVNLNEEKNGTSKLCNKFGAQYSMLQNTDANIIRTYCKYLEDNTNELLDKRRIKKDDITTIELMNNIIIQ